MAVVVSPGHWAAAWHQAITDFQSQIGHRPAPNGSTKNPFKAVFGNKTTAADVQAKLAKLDTAHGKLSGAAKSEFSKAKAAVKAAMKSAEDYIKTIEADIKKAGVAPNEVGELKLLRKTLKAVVLSAEGDIATSERAATRPQKAKKGETSTDLSKRVVAHMQHYPTLMKGALGALKRAEVWLAQMVKADDTGKWNQGIQTATRDIRQQVNNMTARMKADGEDTGKLKQSYRDFTFLLNQTQPWWDGHRMASDQNLHAEMQELKKYLVLYKDALKRFTAAIKT